MKQLLKNFGIIFVVLFAFAAIVSFAEMGSTTPEDVGITRIVEEVQNENVASVDVVGSNLEVTLKDGEGPQLVTKKEVGQSFAEIMTDYGVEANALRTVDVTVKNESGLGFWLRTLMPYLFPFLLLGAIIYFIS